MLTLDECSKADDIRAIARLLAEHETALEKRIKAMNTETAESLALAGKLLMERDDQLHAAEARCAQLEQERDDLIKELRMAQGHD